MKKISIMIILVFLSFSLYAYDFEFFGFSVDFPSAVELSKSISNDGTFKLYLKPSDNGYYFHQNYRIDILDRINILDRRFLVNVYGVIDEEVIPISILSKELLESLVDRNSFNYTTYGSSDERRYVTNKLDLLRLEVPAGNIIGTTNFCDIEEFESISGDLYTRSYTLAYTKSHEGLEEERLVYKINTPEGHLFSEIVIILTSIFSSHTDLDEIGYNPKFENLIFTYINNRIKFYSPDDPELEMIKNDFVERPDRNFRFYTMTTEALAAVSVQDDPRIQLIKAMDEAMKTLTFSAPPSSSILGEVNDDRVRVRSNYNLSSETLGHVNTGEEVIILDRSPNTQQIGDMNDYWYRVISKETALKGWMYGVFLDLK